MRPRAAVLMPALIAALALTASARAGTVETPACKRDLTIASADVSETLARMKGGGKTLEEDKCAAFRRQFLAVVKARAVFASCKTGADRDTEVDRLDGTIEHINGAIAESCAVQ